MDSSNDRIICSVCGGELGVDEPPVRIPAIGFMHRDCKGDPWKGFTGQSWADADDALIMDPLVRQISELRAALADSEARRAELEAVISESLVVEDKHPDTAFYVIVGHMRAALMKTPSVVLEDRDRENRAIGWDEGFVTGFDQDASRPDDLNPYRGDTT